MYVISVRILVLMNYVVIILDLVCCLCFLFDCCQSYGMRDALSNRAGLSNIIMFKKPLLVPLTIIRENTVPQIGKLKIKVCFQS